MFERIIARMPLLLMVAVVVLTVQVAFVQNRRTERVVAAVPLAIVTLLYFRAGRGGGGGRGSRGRARSERSRSEAEA